MNPTPRQAEVLCWIARFTDELSISPTYREIAVAFEMSHSAARKLVDGLRDRGLLEYGYGKHRATEITDAGQAFVDGQGCK